ncbi:calbindin-32-like isoform X2 [Paramacrobiotus metropolitanus]|uniref:calbindin-32-like isoform X2 n=1 Tax=Paramacrobiotus metropolitanus TaxID=2943436 RepID=UPI00244634F1|nr:calbindin-32-like isoform X2 [Paramacrobiotus metropolitanus]
MAKRAIPPSNYLDQYLLKGSDSPRLQKLTAAQFMDVWAHYDSDANGFIEGNELDSFLHEFLAAVMNLPNPDTIPKKTLDDLKRSFMEEYDVNGDGKIEIKELAQLLPLDENFFLLFRFNNPLESSVEFMRIWKQFDKDYSGYIEADELKDFLRAVILRSNSSAALDDDKLLEYTDSILRIFDTNKDGKLQLSEMAQLLPVKENFLNRAVFKGSLRTLTAQDVENVFVLYDRDGNGMIENEELYGLCKDLLELAKSEYDMDDLEAFYDAIIKGCDINHDGKINQKELTMILLAIAKTAAEDEQKEAGTPTESP